MDFRIKHFLKKNAILSSIGYKYREVKTSGKMKRYQNYPVARKVLFASGRYGDSLRRISELLHMLDSSIEIVWAYRSGEDIFKSEYPSYIKTVLFESNEYYKELSTSAVWIFNVLIPQGTIKRKEQMYIQVWHGDKPFKRIGNDAANGNSNYKRQSAGRKFSEDKLCDLFVTGSDLFIQIWEKSMGYSGRVLNTGLPRNDDFFNRSLDLELIRKELNIPSDKRILIYAPTFRDHIADNGKIGTDINICEILDVLERKYNCGWICLKRSHGGTHLDLDGTKNDTRIIDVSQYRDMTNLMLISDMLITDYSSCAGDFAYSGKPVLLYQDDYESYTSKDRSLIFDMKKTPFYVAHNMRQLLNIINSLKDDDVYENDKAILRLYRSTQTDHSTKDVCSIIVKHISVKLK